MEQKKHIENHPTREKHVVFVLCWADFVGKLVKKTIHWYIYIFFFPNTENEGFPNQLLKIPRGKLR